MTNDEVMRILGCFKAASCRALKSWEKFYRACLPAWGGLFSHLFSLMVAIAAIFHVQPSLRRSRSQRHSKATTIPEKLKNWVQKNHFCHLFNNFQFLFFNFDYQLNFVQICNSPSFTKAYTLGQKTNFWSKNQVWWNLV